MRSLFAIALAALSACAPAAAKEVPRCGYAVRAVYPHDARAFTQGLIYRDGALFESTGLEGLSTIRKVRLADGVVTRTVSLPPSLFGEGLVDWKRELVSVTWRSGVGFRWDIDSFRRLGRFSYPGEGWGLTQDGSSLILSDGTSRLRFLDPATLREKSSLDVTADGTPVAMLNELEWIGGEILANVWQTDRIARIDPSTGRVKAWIDLAGLRAIAGARGSDDVLNGIAYDRKGDRLFVTGKNWPKLFQIGLVDAQPRTRDRASVAACPPIGKRRAAGAP